MRQDSDQSDRTVLVPKTKAGKKRDRTGRTTTAMPRSPSEALEPHRAPPAPRGRRIPKERTSRAAPFVRFLSGVITLSLMLMIGAGTGYFVFRGWYDNPGPLAHTRTFAIPNGEGVNAIAERLEREGIISDRRVFTAAYYWFRMRQRDGTKQAVLKAGEYEIKKGASMRQVMDTLVEGKSILSKVTIAEGLTSFQIVERLNQHADLTGTIEKLPAEGSLLPDTYKFSRGMSRQELIERMQAEQQRVVAAAWEKRAQGLPFRTPEEAVIMASIVEKETGRSDERTRVAAVFVNRMRQRMRLQSDPTIVYGITMGKGSLGRGILRSEIDQKTAYNTYQIDGLPPTPIANPGRAAIEATLDPAQTDELYFVANGTGGHAFARTLSEHNRNVAAWRRIEREAQAKKSDEPQQPGSGPAVITVPQPAAASASDVPIPVRKPKR